MQVIFRKRFKKQLKKLPPKIEQQFIDRLRLFVSDQTAPLLRIHTLSGTRYPLQSMNITADYRALFILEGETAVFYEIGTHSELYS
jgi:mRNA-degrading endonuclease YafQ of YafQ-DinJ toxin-antitoxin module